MHERLGFSISVALLATLLLAGCGNGAGPAPPQQAWAPAFDAGPFGWLMSVHGPSDGSGRLWAVGGAFTPTGGAMQRFDGAAWAPVPLPEPVPLLNWAFALSSDDVIVVGAEGTILRWDGATWRREECPTEQDLWGVWGVGEEDLWAVGGDGRSEASATLLRNQGQGWAAVPLPALERPGVGQLTKVWGTSGDNVYFVGQNGVVLRWDGAELEELFVGSSDDLVSLWGTGPDRIAIVGGRSVGVVVTWDGASWRHEKSGLWPGLNGIWMANDDRIYVAGREGALLELDFDTLETRHEETPTGLDFHAIFGSDTGRLTAVGGNLIFAQGPYQGVAFMREVLGVW